jgi:hypothetical protein
VDSKIEQTQEHIIHVQYSIENESIIFETKRKKTQDFFGAFWAYNRPYLTEYSNYELWAAANLWGFSVCERS